MQIDLSAVPEGSGYPTPFDAPCAARTRVASATRAGLMTSASI